MHTASVQYTHIYADPSESYKLSLSVFITIPSQGRNSMVSFRSKWALGGGPMRTRLVPCVGTEEFRSRASLVTDIALKPARFFHNILLVISCVCRATQPTSLVLRIFSLFYHLSGLGGQSHRIPPTVFNVFRSVSPRVLSVHGTTSFETRANGLTARTQNFSVFACLPCPCFRLDSKACTS